MGAFPSLVTFLVCDLLCVFVASPSLICMFNMWSDSWKEITTAYFTRWSIAFFDCSCILAVSSIRISTPGVFQGPRLPKRASQITMCISPISCEIDVLTAAASSSSGLGMVIDKSKKDVNLTGCFNSIENERPPWLWRDDVTCDANRILGSGW